MKVLLLIIAMLSFSAFSGVSLTCSGTEEVGILIGNKRHRFIDQKYTYKSGHGAIIFYETYRVACNDKENNIYLMDFDGWGPGIEFSLSNISKFYCPFANKYQIEGKYGGLKVGAGLGIGFDLALFQNPRIPELPTGVPGKSLCYLAGLSADLGAAVSGGTLEIRKIHLKGKIRF